MASTIRPSLLPQCTSCIRRVTRRGLDQWGQQQQTRNISKAAKEAERNIVVKLREDIPRFGRAGSYVPINPALMRNKWFPARVADYVPAVQLKQLKAQDVDMNRDATFGVKATLEEAEEEVEVSRPRQHYVRPIEIEQLSAERSMELIDTFVPPTIDFARQLIEQEKTETKRYGASNAADILNFAMSASKPKPLENAIYGSVSTADIVATIKSALAHNDEAARVILAENDVHFVSGHEEGDTSKVKQLGMFKVEIGVPGAAQPLTRQVRIRAKE
ncbi:hypothetical protein DPSP01_008358 [Paraphaeosphaeria sporulosa]|uniref:Ribosomal protein L9 domain-containing protein n=1 Tax=Paraphaeosphaeria sporulosa TaxID=1460663 RepID=A0A177CM80_9PLEO|nr:uncharacterized protein CC84DRAFT_1162068 [Paraphaeosphaeria sporulosa]OAG08052.1 hypothetical protein CC84DRAFT_1162068 [Paraphaeosphaeria sporulosa]